MDQLSVRTADGNSPQGLAPTYRVAVPLATSEDDEADDARRTVRMLGLVLLGELGASAAVMGALLWRLLLR